jgi:hypothetical protein
VNPRLCSNHLPSTIPATSFVFAVAVRHAELIEITFANPISYKSSWSSNARTAQIQQVIKFKVNSINFPSTYTSRHPFHNQPSIMFASQIPFTQNSITPTKDYHCFNCSHINLRIFQIANLITKPQNALEINCNTKDSQLPRAIKLERKISIGNGNHELNIQCAK